MTGQLHRAASSILILTLVICPLVRGDEKPPLKKRPDITPAGTIDSPGMIRIDGHIARSGTKLWGSELLQAPEVESAQVMLNEVGQLSLRGGSTIKLASVLREDEGAAPARTLFAFLMAGEMIIQLNDRANARICAGKTIFAFSPGASARVLVREGRGRLLASNGAVSLSADWHLFQAAPDVINPAVGQSLNQGGAQMTPGEYKIEPYNFAFSLGGYADIEARSTRYLQFRVTDKDDKPAPDLLLLILLKNKGDSTDDVGSINYGAAMMRVKTDQNGVATARFDASIVIGAIAPLEVIIAKNNQTLKANIRIVKPKGFWTLKNAGPVMGVVATAAIVAVAAHPFNREIPPRPPLSFSESVVIP